MNRSLLLKSHRWIGLTFGAPLLAIIATGLILSFEPMVQFNAIKPQSIDAARVVDLLQQYDPERKARGITIDAAARHLMIQGANREEVDLVIGEPAATRSTLAALFQWARMTHERLLGQPWLVTASTIAMLVMMVLGILLGWPRWQNSIAGWHKGTAWLTLPLILLSPFTGLCMALGLTLQSGPAPARGGRLIALSDAIGMVAKSHDLGQVTSIGFRGGRMMARLFEGGELRAYAVTPDGLVALPRNWPRLIHEGNWSAWIGGPVNVLVSAALLGLLTTGVLIWGLRQIGRRRHRLTVVARIYPSAPPSSAE